MPKDVNIQPGEFRGWDIEAKGYQERNLQTFLETISNKEAQKSIESLAKIEKDDWISMNGVIQKIKGFAAGTDLGILSGVGDTLRDTIRTELNNAIAPLKNELMNMINQLFAPFLPLIEDAVAAISTLIARGMGAIQSLIEGRFEEWFRQEQLTMQETGAPQAFQTWITETRAEQMLIYYESMYHQGHPEMIPAWAVDILNQYGSFAAYEAAASAGGVYSGQFDLDPSVIDDILSNLKLPTFDEEED